MPVTPLTIDNIPCNRVMADHHLAVPSKYVPQTAAVIPQRKQSVFVAPSGINSILRSPFPPPPLPPPPVPLSRPLSINTSLSHLSPPLPQHHHQQQISTTTVPSLAPIVSPKILTFSPPGLSSSGLANLNPNLLRPNAQNLEHISRINKIISENEAIVETLDPLWHKRWPARNSTSSLTSRMVNGLPTTAITTTSSVLSCITTNGSANNRRYSEVHSNQPLSKLQSALLGKAPTPGVTNNLLPTRKYSEFSSHENHSQQSVIINAKDTNNNNNVLNNNNINNFNLNNNININNTNSNDSEHNFTSESIVRNLLTTKTPIQLSPPGKVSPPANSGGHPQNPEGSIIKDLLLKSRDEAKKSRQHQQPVQSEMQTITTTTTSAPQPQVTTEHESTMLVYVCTVCNIAFRNKENLEVHQYHYCKGNDDMSITRPTKQKLDNLVQRKVSVMARPGFGMSPVKHYTHQNRQSVLHSQQSSPQQRHSTTGGPMPPIGNILKQQLLAPNQGPPLKKRKISEPVFRSSNNNHLLPDIQIIEEHSVRRVSVVQPTHPVTGQSSPNYTSKSNHLTALEPASGGRMPSISASHTVIQPVLHSGATVIENYLSSQCNNKSYPIGFDTISTCRTSVLNNWPTDLVSDPSKKKIPIEILPAYLPHLSRPTTKITFKEPIVFPVLKNQFANDPNVEFTVDFNFNSANYSANISERKSSMCGYKQVASMPEPTTVDDKCQMNSKECDGKVDSDKTDSEISFVDKENDKLLTTVVSSLPINGLIGCKSTGAVRPTTLSLRPNNSSNLVSSTLVSPDTPRPDKSCVELFMNGHAYSRIGLKAKPRPVYLTVYQAQPMCGRQEYDPNLSMYSNWIPRPISTDDVMNLASPSTILGLYDLKGSHSPITTSAIKGDLTITHSSYWTYHKSDEEKENLKRNVEIIAKMRHELGENMEQQVFRKISEVSASSAYSGDTDEDCGEAGTPPKRVRIFEGGFKSNEDYTYVRGRGRGKYVCEECGIRCKKPSMLKKHIRTHTDLRPYSCRHCAFAFKTKGNLTKHMKSKAHHKKCVELGIIPVPITIDDSQIDTEALAKQEMLEITCGNLPEDEDEDEDEGEWDEDDDEEDDEGVPIPLIELQRMAPAVPGQFDDADFDCRPHTISESGSAATEAEEQEAAHSLLILSGSGSESDLTNTTRKISATVEDIANSPDRRRVSVIDRKISQHMMEEKQRRISLQMIEMEKQRRISQHILDSDQQRLISQHMIPAFKPNEVIDYHSVPTIMKPPSDSLPPPPQVMTSPRKLSPIQQLEQQVQQQHQQQQQQQQHMLQTTWTPNFDQMSRPRSYSFNDMSRLPSNHNTFASNTRVPVEPIEAISEEDSNGSEDSFAARRYSTSVLGDRSFQSPHNPTNNLSAISEREEPMDLSTKPNEPMDGIVFPQIPQTNCVTTGMPQSGLPLGLRQGEFIPKAPQRVVVDSVDGKSICSICSKQFSKPSQLRLHENIHYFERPFRCESCAVSFRTKGHLQKHKRSVSHFNKVNINMTFGTPTTDNPRPFKCDDCKIAFRIHGHLAKHLRSKMHIMKLECLGKLPFGMYAEMERSIVNLNEIDTTDCENSLLSLQALAQRLYDPRQMRWASEPVANNNNIDGPYDDGSQVKDEPNDAYYHALDRERKSLLPANCHPLPPAPESTSPTLANQTTPRLPSPSLSPLQSIQPPPPQTTPKSHSPAPTPTPTPPQSQPQPQSQTGFTSTRSNTCHICGQTFKAAKFLQVHLYCDHQNDSSSPQDDDDDDRHDYECDVCHKGFTDESAFKKHMFGHTAARPHVCDLCDAGFTTTLLLDSHMQTHHHRAQQTA